ncbi:hypothetical protein [Streptomyces roseolus]|uniref:hypothetical protein n=1 Tax=Streptomyces roseolus TaxID=67358 RepID=UPI0036462C54
MDELKLGPTAPGEHCGHQPEPAIAGPTECVLRPGHSGSHADHTGMRWYMRLGRGDILQGHDERLLSTAAIQAAAFAISDYALTHLGRDLGTVHIEPMAEAGIRAALRASERPEVFGAA